MQAGGLPHFEHRKCSAAMPSPIGQFSRLNLAITGWYGSTALCPQEQVTSMSRRCLAKS